MNRIPSVKSQSLEYPTLVSLSDLEWDENKIVGRVLVKNITYEKYVFSRITFDSWKNFHDEQALWKEGDGNTDVFYFTSKWPEKNTAAEFAICATQGDITAWDNNNWKNFYITKEVKSIPIIPINHPTQVEKPQKTMLPSLTESLEEEENEKTTETQNFLLDDIVLSLQSSKEGTPLYAVSTQGVESKPPEAGKSLRISLTEDSEKEEKEEMTNAETIEAQNLILNDIVSSLQSSIEEPPPPYSVSTQEVESEPPVSATSLVAQALVNEVVNIREVVKTEKPESTVGGRARTNANESVKTIQKDVKTERSESTVSGGAQTSNNKTVKTTQNVKTEKPESTVSHRAQTSNNKTVKITQDVKTVKHESVVNQRAQTPTNKASSAIKDVKKGKPPSAQNSSNKTNIASGKSSSRTSQKSGKWASLQRLLSKTDTSSNDANSGSSSSQTVPNKIGRKSFIQKVFNKILPKIFKK